MEILLKYFPELSKEQQDKFILHSKLFREWNEKINLISRKDVENLFERHILHSLGIAKVIRFKPHTKILDVGTGGGFPGIPLAILYPEAEFHLVDSIGKKIKVVKDLSENLELKNVTAEQKRVEEVKGLFDFITARAVTSLTEFYPLVKKNIHPISFNDLHNGILYLKGGDISGEIGGMKSKVKIFPLKNYFEEEFFETKYVVYLQK
jgi:16S rRNA (guanine527-N7)-methyltransferase